VSNNFCKCRHARLPKDILQNTDLLRALTPIAPKAHLQQCHRGHKWNAVYKSATHEVGGSPRRGRTLRGGAGCSAASVYGRLVVTEGGRHSPRPCRLMCDTGKKKKKRMASHGVKTALVAQATPKHSYHGHPTRLPYACEAQTTTRFRPSQLRPAGAKESNTRFSWPDHRHSKVPSQITSSGMVSMIGSL
jgi:hypothetical protein